MTQKSSKRNTNATKTERKTKIQPKIYGVRIKRTIYCSSFTTGVINCHCHGQFSRQDFYLFVAYKNHLLVKATTAP